MTHFPSGTTFYLVNILQMSSTRPPGEKRLWGGEFARALLAGGPGTFAGTFVCSDSQKQTFCLILVVEINILIEVVFDTKTSVFK